MCVYNKKSMCACICVCVCVCVWGGGGEWGVVLIDILVSQLGLQTKIPNSALICQYLLFPPKND